jgi:hypothetical protein
MMTLILPSIAILLALAAIGNGQTRWRELTAEQQTARIEAIRETRRQKIRTERIAIRQQAREAGRQEARATRARDRAFMAVWTGLTPETRTMGDARELAERLSRKPEWPTQTRAQRIAATTGFITGYPAIKGARSQEAMNAALGERGAAYPERPDVARLAQTLAPSPREIAAFVHVGDPVALAASVHLPQIIEFPTAEVPDLFTINRRFNWNKPHGQWMNQMLKEIDAAKTAGDTATYDDLTKCYSAWADQYLRQNR